MFNGMKCQNVRLIQIIAVFLYPKEQCMSIIEYIRMRGGYVRAMDVESRAMSDVRCKMENVRGKKEESILVDDESQPRLAFYRLSGRRK